MNILFFTRLFYPHIGGVEKHVLEVGKLLVKKGHFVTVVTEEDGLIEKIDGINVLRINVGKSEFYKKFIIWWWLWQHRSLIKKADIVHCHDVFFWYLPFRFLYPKKPVFTTFHGYETRFPLSKKAIIIRKLSEKLSWGNICVGDYIKKWYGTKPTYTTYGGVDVGKTQNSKLKTQNYNLKPKILFIGRLEKDTGVSIYLKTLEILKKKRINFEFEVCGDGPLRNKVAKWGKVHGFVKDLTPYIGRSDIVFSSSYLSILEALANKKLVFAGFNNSLKKDYLNMAPFAKWIIIKESPKELAKKLEYFLSHPDETKKRIKEAYKWISNQSWKKVVDEYIKLWRMEGRQI